MTKKTGEAKGEQFTFETDEERKLWFERVERIGSSATTIGEALREAVAFILEVRKRDGCTETPHSLPATQITRIVAWMAWADNTDEQCPPEPPEESEDLFKDILAACDRRPRTKR